MSDGRCATTIAVDRHRKYQQSFNGNKLDLFEKWTSISRQSPACQKDGESGKEMPDI